MYIYIFLQRKCLHIHMQLRLNRKTDSLSRVSGSCLRLFYGTIYGVMLEEKFPNHSGRGGEKVFPKKGVQKERERERNREREREGEKERARERSP